MEGTTQFISKKIGEDNLCIPLHVMLILICKYINVITQICAALTQHHVIVSLAAISLVDITLKHTIWKMELVLRPRAVR